MGKRRINSQRTPGPVCFNLKFSSGNYTQIVSLQPISSQDSQIIVYLATVNGFATSTIALGKVTTLDPNSPIPINDPSFRRKISQRMDGLT